MIFKIFFAKHLAFFAQTPAGFCKNMIITLVLEKTPICSQQMGKNRRKSTPDVGDFLTLIIWSAYFYRRCHVLKICLRWVWAVFWASFGGRWAILSPEHLVTLDAN
jgi:hypothetical protein